MTETTSTSGTNRLLSPDEAAEFLGVSRATVYRLMKDRDIAYSQVCGRRRFRLRDLETFVDSRLVKAR